MSEHGMLTKLNSYLAQSEKTRRWDAQGKEGTKEGIKGLPMTERREPKMINAKW